MIDFPIMPEDASKASWIFCSAIYFSVMFLFKRQALDEDVPEEYEFRNRKTFLSLSFLLILCSFYSGDWAHYQTLVLEYKGYGYSHLDEIYRHLVVLIDNNYLLFRIIIWGGGYIALFYTFRLCGLNPYVSLYYLFCIYVTTYSYARAGVAMASYFVGVSLVFSDIELKKYQKYIVGIFFIGLSYFLHKSMIVLILLTPLAFFPINKKSILLIIIAVIGIGFSFSLLMRFATEFLMSSEDLATSASLYISESGSVTEGHSLTGSIITLWSKLIVHVPFLLCIYYMFKDEHVEYIQRNVVSIFRIAFGLYIFTIFMLVTYGSAAALYYRYEGMLYIPITILMCALRREEIITEKVFRIIFWFCAGYQIQMFVYRLIFR